MQFRKVAHFLSSHCSDCFRFCREDLVDKLKGGTNFQNFCWAAWLIRPSRLTGAAWPPERVQAGPPKITENLRFENN